MSDASASRPPMPPMPSSRPARLRDGTPVVIRVIRPDDRDRIVEAFGKLEPDSIYTRFFSARKALTDAELERLGATDFVNFVGLAVTLGSGDDETVIGGASYVALPPVAGVRAAEVAFTIEEDYQGQGLASTLLRTLAEIARRHGIQRLEAEVLAGNAPMLKVFERSGWPMAKTREGGVTHIALDLRQDHGKP
jgi:RimJ/RimL family protein N-acetyltransferase